MDITVIETFLKSKDVEINGNYTILENGVIDVEGDICINLMFSSLVTELPIKFGKIIGYFELHNNFFTKSDNFPDSVTGWCVFSNMHKLKKINKHIECHSLSILNCQKLKTLENIFYKKILLQNTNIETFFKNLPNNCNYIESQKLPNPSLDEIRYLIKLNPELITDKKAPWITLIKDYWNHKDIFRAIGDFEKMYNEPWLIHKDRINTNLLEDISISFE